MVIRRTQVVSEKIQDLTIKGGNIADRTDAVGISGSAKLMKYSVGSPELGSTTPAVDFARAYHIMQRGSVPLSATASYVPFTTEYGTPPVVQLEPQGSNISYYYKSTVAPGSFSLLGSPIGKYVNWDAFGFR